MINSKSVLKTLDIILFEKKLLGTMGYHDMMLFSIEILQICVFLQNMSQFHGFRGTPNGTQMVPKILSSQSMMSEVFKTVSNILITYLDQFL